ncbi:MAG: phosphatidylinositol mannoside acyltransferase [Scrofimicrobium sp.]
MIASVYRIAWRVLPKLPQGLVIWFAHLAADIVCLLGGSSVRQMQKNYERLSGRAVSKKELREGVRSYFRCFAQMFTLSGWSAAEIESGCFWPDGARDAEWLKDGPVVLALTHSGNWDLAGAWFCQTHGKIVTVAEKLNPEDLFDQFVEFRESLGMEIIGVGPGDHVFTELVEKTQGRPVLVPLLADRDISGAGIEVDLGHAKALVAAGPAALALKLNRPLIAGHISYVYQNGRWTVRALFSDPVEMPELREGETETEALTRAWVDEISPVMIDHMVDWHMMQKVFVDDLDPQRLARARQRAEEDK